MRQPAVFIGLFAALGPLLGCSEEPPAGNPEPLVKEHGLLPEQAAAPLVKIGDRMITVGTFAEKLAEKSPYLRARYSSPERRKEFLDELVKVELLSIEAEREGLFNSPLVQRTRQQVMIQQMMKAEFEDSVRLSDITDQEIEAYYAAHPEEFNKPEQVRASQIVVADRKKAEKLLKQVLADPENNKLFRQLARDESEDAATSARGGDLQFFARPEERPDTDPEVPDAVARAAFALSKIGDVAPELVQTPSGYHIVKLTGQRRALARTLDHARRPIQNRLWREKRDAAIAAFVAGLRERAHVEEHWERLDAVLSPAEAPAPGEPAAGSAGRAKKAKE